MQVIYLSFRVIYLSFLETVYSYIFVWSILLPKNRIYVFRNVKFSFMQVMIL